ncbi:MAG: ATPase, T2SS/T4P/T4SS family [Sodalis sp. (in: enterobacteria)]|uniref:ATPase, T2SS/T4P/T4SS family n=1 Tax=Sodalis sp. (in: enterobacteria) TaxID=1898979 RepID=UPI003F3A4279
MLNMLRWRPLNICSVEDPVEVPLTGINQCQVNPRVRLDFPPLLRGAAASRPGRADGWRDPRSGNRCRSAERCPRRPSGPFNATHAVR